MEAFEVRPLEVINGRAFRRRIGSAIKTDVRVDSHSLPIARGVRKRISSVSVSRT